MKAPKAPKPDASQLAQEERQSRLIEEEMEEEEKRTKAIVRGTGGSKSLLAKATPMGSKNNQGRGRAGGGAMSFRARAPRGMGLIASPNRSYQSAIDNTVKAK